MKSHRSVRLIGASSLGLLGLGTVGAVAPNIIGDIAPAGAVTTCVAAGTTGLTAAQVATTNEVISATTVDATGCDYGIYVGPGVTGVTIGGTVPADAVTVSGAIDTGIFAEQTDHLTIENVTSQNNGVTPTPNLISFGGIVLAGVSVATVTGNTVVNNGGGGIFVNDNGPVDPGSPNAGPSTPVPANTDEVNQNTISGNYGACGIIYATHNTGGTISSGVITNNVITGHIGVIKATGPDLGGIVVAAASVGATVTNTHISGNTVSGSYEGGIIVHSHAPHDVVTGTLITGNTVINGNNWGQTNGPPTTVGIIVGVDQLPPAIAAQILDTTVSGNSISGQFYGLWISGVPGVVTTPVNTISVLTGGTPIYTTPVPGSGYWQVASDGGVFTYGSAGFYGSAGGINLNKPIVGITTTQDQGGYWLVASDGGVFTYGDATFFGSTGNIKLNKPVVGMASTPYVPGANGDPAAPAGLGYWLVAADGGVFNYGDAGFFGSAGNLKLNSPIVGMAASPDGKGYWLVGADGGVFNYGDASFFGSAGGLKLNKPVVGISASPDGKGYWLVASDGGVFNYGDASFFGSAGGIKLNKPVVGVASVGITTSG